MTPPLGSSLVAPAAIRPFTVEIPRSELDDLRARLAATRWPEPAPGRGWDYGTDVDWLRALCEYWADGFDWRTQEAVLNEWPQVLVRVGDRDVHCVHVPGTGPDPMPLVATHGWPSTTFELHKVIGPLTDPAAYGGDAGDAFSLVVPSLPGYGFSAAPAEPGFGAPQVADVWVELMAALGYDRFASHGGDWGSAVTTALGARHPERMIGLHLTMAAPPVDPAALTPSQRAWWDELQQYRDREWGYVHLQRTKPQTPAFALTDSPAGLAAWILEKFHAWSDCDGDVAKRFTNDELLTNIMFYWATETANSSVRLYCETMRAGKFPPTGFRVEVPTGCALFAKEIVRPPRAWVEKTYNVQRWSRFASGGHFAAMEEPQALVEDIRAFFRPLR
jgi:microsomal epoxide hydrolase